MHVADNPSQEKRTREDADDLCRINPARRIWLLHGDPRGNTCARDRGANCGTNIVDDQRAGRHARRDPTFSNVRANGRGTADNRACHCLSRLHHLHPCAR